MEEEKEDEDKEESRGTKDEEMEGEEEEETEHEARGPVPSREPPPPFRRISESVGDDAAAVGSERATSVALLPATLPRRGNRRCQNTWLRQSLDVRPGQVTGFFLGWDRRHDWNYSLSLFFFELPLRICTLRPSVFPCRGFPL